jgi:hypothetical protein
LGNCPTELAVDARVMERLSTAQAAAARFRQGCGSLKIGVCGDPFPMRRSNQIISHTVIANLGPGMYSKVEEWTEDMKLI